MILPIVAKNLGKFVSSPQNLFGFVRTTMSAYIYCYVRAKFQQNNWHKKVRYYGTEKILYHITTYDILVKYAIR